MYKQEQEQKERIFQELKTRLEDSEKNHLTLAKQKAVLLHNLQNFEKEQQKTQNKLVNLQRQLQEANEETKRQKGRAQSAHTLKGQLLEKWAPFCKVLGLEKHWRPEDWTFFGNPLDYVVWDYKKNPKENQKKGKIYFLEIKAGKSKLSTKQRRIRELIENKQVEFRQINLN